MRTFIEQLIKVWRIDVKNQLNNGLILYERQLQVFMYERLRKRLGSDYKVWIEPVIKNLKDELVKPDFVIVKKVQLILLLSKNLHLGNF